MTPACTLLISEVFPPRTGGSGRWFWEVYRRLPRDGYVIAAGEHPDQEQFDRTHHLRLVRLPLTLPSWGLSHLGALKGYWRAFRTIRRLAKTEGVQQIHCGRCLPEGVLGLALKYWHGSAYVCYAHGEELNYATSSRELSWLMFRVLNGAEFIIANSRNTRGLLSHAWGLPLERIRILHPGVDTKRFHPTPRDVAVRNQIGWGDRPVILTVGRLQKRKGHDVLISALHLIRPHVPNILYAIVGDGEERRTLEELVRREGLGEHVLFMGEINDVDLIRSYQQCDLFVLPNRQVGQDIEGFGMVLLEAQACGKAVLAGASGGTAEAMNVGVSGQVVDCTSVQSLGRCLTECLGEGARLRAMAAAARDWVVQNHDWTALVKQAQATFAPTAPRAGRAPLVHCATNDGHAPT